MHRPDNWVILEIPAEDETLYKVLAGWSGGYLDGDAWRMNSGIAKIKEDGDYYLIEGYSGSTYKCHKDSECLRMNNMHIYTQIKESGKATLVDIDDIKEKFK